MKKGQSDLISIVIIVGISISLLSTAYFWGLPLIQKYQDTSKFKQIYSSFSPDNPSSLPNLIVELVRNGGSEEFNFPFEGGIELYEIENSITFSFTSKVSGLAPDVGWVSLTKTGCSVSEGILGVDKPYIVCAKSERKGDGFVITFNLTTRDLISDGTIYRIDLEKQTGSVSSSYSSKIRFTYEGKEETESLITYKIKVLLG
ncbi:MAG: hypothetical protein J7L39_04135 [Candidatus Aenigmarchaeota archaeon]|nr:hypothetical protein [Candidatus Aenigmarchaeota archaeon]